MQGQQGSKPAPVVVLMDSDEEEADEATAAGAAGAGATPSAARPGAGVKSPGAGPQVLGERLRVSQALVNTAFGQGGQPVRLPLDVLLRVRADNKRLRVEHRGQVKTSLCPCIQYSYLHAPCFLHGSACIPA